MDYLRTRYEPREPTPTKYKAKRTVRAQAGSFSSLQLPVIICGEHYKSVIDLGLPTTLISAAIWQKVGSPLFPISENEITDRVIRRTGLQLMGYTHFSLEVKNTVLELEDALVYDYDESEIFLNVSAVAALGLVVDFQEGTFGIRTDERLRCNWNEDTLLFPDSKLGNLGLLNKQMHSASNYPSGSIDNNGGYTSDLTSYRPHVNPMAGSVMEPVPFEMEQYQINQMQFMPQMGYNELSFDSAYADDRHISSEMRVVGRQSVSKKKKFKNFYLKNSASNIVVPVSGTLGQIASWNKNHIPNTNSKGSVPANKPAESKNQGKSANAKRNARKNLRKSKKLSAALKNDVPQNQKPGTSPKHSQNADYDAQKPQKKMFCLNCKSNDHFIGKCKKPITLKCVYCQQTGHERNSCPTILKTSTPGTDVSETLPGTTGNQSLTAAMTDPTTPKSSNTGEVKSVETGTKSGSQKRPGETPKKVIVKKMKVVQNTTSTPNLNTKPGVRKVVKKVIRKVVVPKQANTASTSLSEGDSLSVKEPRAQTQATLPTQEVSPKQNDAVSHKSENSSSKPIPQFPKPVEPLVETQTKFTTQTTVQKISDSTSKEHEKPTLKPKSELLEELKNTSKKSEADISVRVPVERVVTKKNIKLNMLSKPASDTGNAEAKASDAAVELSTSIKDSSASLDNATSAQ